MRHESARLREEESRRRQAGANRSHQVHPWRRFFARSVDGYIYGFITFMVVAGMSLAQSEVIGGLPAPHSSKALEWELYIFYLVFSWASWLLIEALFLSNWGTTPGKFSFSIDVRRSDGKLLSYAEGLSRAFSVWLRGEGLNIPIVSIFTHLNAWRVLKNTGKTTWDRNGDFEMIHGDLHAGRILLAAAGLCLLIMLMKAMTL